MCTVVRDRVKTKILTTKILLRRKSLIIPIVILYTIVNISSPHSYLPNLIVIDVSTGHGNLEVIGTQKDWSAIPANVWSSRANKSWIVRQGWRYHTES